jgi:two-component system, LytTR family, sensor histidine kinase AlgZ
MNATDDRTAASPSGFGPLTTFDDTAAGALAHADATTAPVRFDVCHVGVVLRATLFVHTVLAIGTLFVAPTLGAWALQFALSAAVAVPAMLAWLIAACALKGVLSRMSSPAQWLSTALLGAACAGAAQTLAAQVSLGDADRMNPLAPAAAGAAFAVVMVQWLRLRTLTRTPADTTAKLAELQSRIRPHFLFNTLNSALALVRLDPPRAELVLEDLAELFRVALTDTGGAVTLTDEIDLAQRYLAIEQIRFGRRLAVTWDIDPAAGAARMPPLLLQPLIENAVRHGVEPAANGGEIQVRTRAKNGRVLITVINSVASTPSQPGNGIALRNVQDRLRLLHDVAVQFEARREGDTFRVKIELPL